MAEDYEDLIRWLRENALLGEQMINTALSRGDPEKMDAEPVRWLAKRLGETADALTKLLAENERLKDLVQTLSQQDETASGHPNSHFPQFKLLKDDAGVLELIDTLHSRIEELEEALKPFAEAESPQDDDPHDLTDLASEGGAACMITYGELRRARSLYASAPPSSEEPALAGDTARPPRTPSYHGE